MLTLQFPKDHFIIPINGQFLLYAPLKRLLYCLNENALYEVSQGLFQSNHNTLPLTTSGIVKELVSTPDIAVSDQLSEIFSWHELTLDLSTECTSSCVYCYAEAGERTIKFMDLNCAIAAIDLCVKKILTLPSTDEHYLNLAFHGGSEPTTNWNLFVQVFNYATQTCQNNKIQLTTSMSSNGYYSEERAVWIAEHLNNVSVVVQFKLILLH